MSLPSPLLSAQDPSISPATGIPVHAGRNYGFEIKGVERDTVSSDESLGALVGQMNEQNGWGPLGSYTERATYFSAAYEIRRTPLPDLQPTAFRVDFEVPGDRDDVVCFTVQNRGTEGSQPFRVSLGIEGARQGPRDISAFGLAAGESREQCIGLRLPDSGGQLMLVVDREGTVPELDETNNLFQQLLVQTQAGGSGPVATAGTANADPGANPSPRATTPGSAQADLTVTAIRVNGQAPDGEEDCKKGKNDVAVVLKNGGIGNARDFAVRLVVGGDEDAKEELVANLEAGREREVRFDDVGLKQGERTLTAIVDAKQAVAESKEDNNQLKVTARCKDSD